MYNIGDRIVHPMHGAGVIADIEELEILGEKREYYVLDVSCGRVGVKIPVDKCGEIGVRPVIDRERIDDILDILRQKADKMPENWNKRYRENMDRLKTGDITEVAALVRDIAKADEDNPKKLSSGEKKILNTAIKILKSEIMLSADISSQEALELIEDAMMPQEQL